MASSSTNSSSEPQAVAIKILSQLDGSDRTVELPSVPLSITVGELKGRIRDHMVSNPPPENQRLIHRGRLMAKDDEPLKNIFGKDTAQQILHLVVRDHRAVGGASSTHNGVAHLPHIPAAGQVYTASQPPSTVAQSASAPTTRTVSPNTNITGQAPHQHHPPNHPQPHIHHGAFPHAWPQVPNPGNPNDHITRLHNHHQHNSANRQVVFHAPIAVPPGMIPQQLIPNFGQQHHHHQGHHPTQAIPSSGGNNAGVTSNNQPTTNGAASNVHSAHGPHAAYPPNGSGIHQPPHYVQGVNPDGSRYTMMMQSATATFPMQGQPFPPPFPPFQQFIPPQAQPGRFMPQNNGMRTQNPRANQPSSTPMSSAPSQTPPEYAGPQATIQIMRGLDDDLENLELRASRLLRGDGMGQILTYAADGIARELRELIRSRNLHQRVVNEVLQRDASQPGSLQTTDAHTLQALNENFSQRTSTIRRKLRELGAVTGAQGTLGHQNRSAVPESSTSGRNDAASTSQAPSSGPISAYLVNSPSGPHAIVYSPQGIFSSTRQPGGSNTPHSLTQDTDDLIERTQQLLHQARNGNQDGERRAEAALQRAGNEPRNDPGRDENRNADQARPEGERDGNRNNEDVRVLEPVLHGLWVLVRLFGFVWFFSGGSSRRTWLLVLSAAIVFAAQAGLFGDRLERLRRHFENLLGVPNEERIQEQRQQVNQPLPGQGFEDGNAGVQIRQEGQVERERRRVGAEGTQPDPQATAERLLREARETRQGRMREVIRTIERGVTLFFASLYPGIGERHVAARERQQREAQARADQQANAAHPTTPESSQTPSQTATSDPVVSTTDTSSGESSTKNAVQNQAIGADTPRTDPAEGSSSSASIGATNSGEVRQRQNGTDTQPQGNA